MGSAALVKESPARGRSCCQEGHPLPVVEGWPLSFSFEPGYSLLLTLSFNMTRASQDVGSLLSLLLPCAQLPHVVSLCLFAQGSSRGAGVANCQCAVLT